jgi:hypothetical protein
MKAMPQAIILFSMALPAHSGPWPLIQVRNNFSQTVGLLGRVISPSQGRYLNTGQHKHRMSTTTHQTSMPWVRFEPTIPGSERASCAATVPGRQSHYKGKSNTFRVLMGKPVPKISLGRPCDNIKMDITDVIECKLRICLWLLVRIVSIGGLWY